MAFRSFCCSRPDWVEVELHSEDNLSLLTFLGSSLPPPSITFTKNPVLKHSLKIWAQFRKYFGLWFHCIKSSFQAITSGLGPFQERTGRVFFKDLFTGNTLASFEQLSENFSLPKLSFFWYLQARRFVLSQLSSSFNINKHNH